MIRSVQILFIVGALALLVAVFVYWSGLPAATQAPEPEPAAMGGAAAHGQPPAGMAGAPTHGQAPMGTGHVLAPKPISKPAPPLALPKRDGAMIRLSDYRGRWVLLNFWATWCEPCRDELPHLADLAAKLTGKPIQLVLVSVDKQWQDVDGLIKSINESASAHKAAASWTNAAAMLHDKMGNAVNVIDPEAKSATAFGTSKFPETYLIDPQGKLTTWFIGPKPWAHPESVAYLSKAVAGSATDTAKAPAKEPAEAPTKKPAQTPAKQPASASQKDQ